METLSNNYPLAKKAWFVWVPSMEFYEQANRYADFAETIYADTPGEAKSMFDFKQHDNSNGDTCTFTDVKAKRANDYDKYTFEGKELTKLDIALELKQREWEIKIKNLPEGDYFIQSAGQFVGNMVMWWGVDSKGYTTYIEKAGKYNKSEIIRICQNSDKGQIPWPVEKVLSKASLHVDCQNLDYKDTIL